jgi:hypothetical protein
MTDDERDKAIRSLIKLGLNLSDRLTDAQIEIGALRLAVQQLLPATEAEFDVVVDNARKSLKDGLDHLEQEDVDEALRKWLEGYDGPSH